MKDSDKTLVSVITPVYNGAQTVERTVVSVLNQSYRHIEYLMVDDGSTDATPEVLAQFGHDQRLRVISQANAGRSAARNAALHRASGAYVLFLDADDTLEPTCIDEMLKVAEKHPSAVVHTGWAQLRASGATALMSADLGTASVFETTATRCPFAIHACLVPTATALMVGGFDAGLTFAEDWDFWQRLGRAGVDFVRLPGCFANYNLAARSISSAEALASYNQACRVMSQCYAPDERVPRWAADYAEGLPSCSAPNGPLGIWMWFAGIEAAQGSNFDWLTQALRRLHLGRPLAVLAPDTVAEQFHSGLELGRGLVTPTANYDEGLFYRVRQYSEQFGVDDASLLVASHVVPESLPYSLADVTHAAFSWRDTLPESGAQQGRLQLWRIGSGRFQKVPSAIYDLGDSRQLSFNLLYGLARQARRVGLRLDNWLSVPRRVCAFVRDPARLRRDAAAFFGSAMDLAIRPTMVLELDRPPMVRAGRVALSEFESIFAEEDPWGYDKPYESRKYEEAIELIVELDDCHLLSAAEIGCAEGHFTRQLAGVVDSVLSLDISRTALGRLEERMKQSELANVETGELDIRADAPRGSFDLIVCSEVLYYVPEQDLRAVVDRIVGALKPGGHFVHAHAYEASERDGMPGFGWRQPFGAVAIAAALAEHPDLQCERRIETDLYVVERHVRSRRSTAGRYEFRPIERASLEPEIDDQVLWSGYQTTPGEAARYQTTSLPVLAYHAIGTGAPPALRPYQISRDQFRQQLAWLREHGYRSATLPEITGLVRRGRPIDGKAIAITFDDASRCFGTEAWPLLKAHGFGAILFVPSGHVGGLADWDARYGAPLELLDEQSLNWLSNDGVIVGSHFEHHRPMNCLSTSELITGLQRSRNLLEQLTNQEVRLLAYPYGIHSPEIGRLAGYCGYDLAFTTSGSSVRAFDSRLGLGRILIDGTLDPIEQLVDAVEPVRRSTWRAIRSSLLRPDRLRR